MRPSRTSGNAREVMTDMEYSMNERSISSWISIGSMNPSTVCTPSAGAPLPLWPLVDARGVLVVLLLGMWSWSSDVEEAGVLGVGRDEVLALLDVVAHQDGADLVGEGRLLDADLQQRPPGGVDGGVLQLVEVHLAQALQALEVGLVVRVLGQEGVLGQVVAQVDLLLAHERRVQRGLGDVDVALLDERPHLAEEEGEEEG